MIARIAGDARTPQGSHKFVTSDHWVETENDLFHFPAIFALPAIVAFEVLAVKIRNSWFTVKGLLILGLRKHSS